MESEAGRTDSLYAESDLEEIMDLSQEDHVIKNKLSFHACFSQNVVNE
jgi:hypothetical protein